MKDAELEVWSLCQAADGLPGEPDRKDIWVRVASVKGATQSICILFLQRGFNPKKEGDFSIVILALFRVKSRGKSAEGAFLKALLSALRLSR